jgi:hypothetical protein
METATDNATTLAAVQARIKDGVTKIRAAIANGRAENDPKIIEAREALRALSRERDGLIMAAQAKPESEAKQEQPEPITRANGGPPVISRLAAPSDRKPRMYGRRKTTRVDWAYAPVPRAVFRDLALPMAQRMAVCALADALNLNGHNKDLAIRISYDALAGKMGTANSTARLAVAELVTAGWLEVQPGTGHGVSRYRFTQKAFGDL